MPAAGVSLTWSPVLAPFVEAHTDLLDVLELSPETLWAPDGRGGYVCDEDELARLEALPLPKVVHGVGNPVGGTAAADPVRLELFGRIVTRLGAGHVSEHLSFTQVTAGDRSECTGFMLPPRQTDAGVDAAAAGARAMAGAFAVPFAVENGVSYLRPRHDEMPDGEFLAAVVEAADVGLLLDLHNAYANERNGRQSLDDLAASLPLERVLEVHVAGGLPHGDYWLDAHSGAIPDTVVGFARELLGSLPNLRVLNYELVPTYFAELGADTLARQLEICRELWAGRTEPVPPPRRSPSRTPYGATCPQPSPEPAAWECELAAMVNGRTERADSPLPWHEELARDPGVGIYRFLVSEFRAGSLARALRLTTRLLLIHLGETGVRELYGSFFSAHPPEFFAADEAEAFAAHLAGLRLAVPHLDAVVDFELALLHAYARGVATTVSFAGDATTILGDISRGVRPPPPAAVTQPVVVEAR